MESVPTDSIIYNDFLTLSGIPAEVYDYRLGNRSALEWVIDQYRVTKDDNGNSRPLPSPPPAAAVSSPTPTRVMPPLLPVGDLRPELAAFVAGLKQQHEATVGALRQVTELCRSQQLRIEGVMKELETMNRRLNHLVQRA